MIVHYCNGALGKQLKEWEQWQMPLHQFLPRCKMWWSPSPGTTCWRWDWAELLLFAPLAPGFHKSLFLTLKEWCELQMQSGRAEASIGIYGMVIYTWRRGEGSKELPVQYLSPHPPLEVSLFLLWGSAGLLKAVCRVANYYFVLVAGFHISLKKN